MYWFSILTGEKIPTMFWIMAQKDWGQNPWFWSLGTLQPQSPAPTSYFILEIPNYLCFPKYILCFMPLPMLGPLTKIHPPSTSSCHLRVFLISFSNRLHMLPLPPTHPPLGASAPDVAIVSYASLFLGHSFLYCPQGMVIRYRLVL